MNAALQPRFEVATNEFNSALSRWAVHFGKELGAAVRQQGLLLGKQLIEFTPPKNRSQGLARVEADIRRIIKGVRGTVRPPADRRPLVIVSQTNPRYARHSNALEWGIRQKVEGREAIRVYADQHGNVYGIDAKRFMPSATLRELGETHQRHRISRGRITRAGQADLVTGRWRWLDMVVTRERNVRAFIKRKQGNVGRGKGGWAAGVIGLGGRPANWIAKWAALGTFEDRSKTMNPSVTFRNRSEWASGGDDDRIVANAMQSRARKMVLHIEEAVRKSAAKAAGRSPF